MQLFELVIVLLLGGAALAALSRRVGLPWRSPAQHSPWCLEPPQ